MSSIAVNSASLDIIEATDSISLPEMDSVSLMNRVDSKYVVNEAKIPTLLANVSARYRVLAIEQVRLSPYSTLYFDSPQRELRVNVQ